MDNNDIKNRVIFKIAMSEIQDENTPIKINLINKKYITIACVYLILTSGVVFAKDIENFIKDKFALGKGVQTAVENGYIGHSNNDFVKSEVTVTKEDNKEILDTFDVRIKTCDFIVDDKNMSIELEIKFDEKISKYRDLSKKVNGNSDLEAFGIVEITDLFILDDQKRIIYFPKMCNEKQFNDFCQKHNVNGNYDKLSQTNLYNSDVLSLVEINDTDNSIKLIYNINTNEKIASKHLSFYFEKINLIPKFDDIEAINLSGSWKINIDIPENMYNSEDVTYKVISCDNDKFDIYEAKSTNTGFLIGMTISDVKEPILSEEFRKKVDKVEKDRIYTSVYNEDLKELFEDEKEAQMYVEYRDALNPISIDGNHFLYGENTGGCYVLNSNGDKFTPKPVYLSSDETHAKFIDDDKYDYYEEFEMTKYDATDKITVVIDFCKESVKIELEKVNK